MVELFSMSTSGNSLWSIKQKIQRLVIVLNCINRTCVVAPEAWLLKIGDEIPRLPSGKVTPPSPLHSVCWPGSGRCNNAVVISM